MNAAATAIIIILLLLFLLLLLLLLPNIPYVSDISALAAGGWV